MPSLNENQNYLEQKDIRSQTEFVIDLENENENEKLINFDLNSIADYFVYDEIGNRHKISELWSEFKTIFIFTRSFLCFTSKEYIEDLALVPREKLKEKQIRLVVIGCAHWKHIKNFRKITRYPYLIFCDVDYDIYNKLGFSKVNDYGASNESIHVKSALLSGILSSFFRAVSTSPLFDYQGDFNQQGGSLIVSPGPKLEFFHADKNARNHMPINQLLQKCGIEPVNFKK